MTNNELPRTRAWPTGQREVVRARIAAHQAADEIRQGFGWDGTQGCAIGCSLDRYDHDEYARVILGDSPHGRMVAGLIDDIHEALPHDEARDWPRRVVDALAEGADTTLLLRRWLHWLLSMELSDVANARPMAALMARSLAGDEPAGEEWDAAAAAAADDSAWSRADFYRPTWDVGAEIIRVPPRNDLAARAATAARVAQAAMDAWFARSLRDAEGVGAARVRRMAARAAGGGAAASTRRMADALIAIMRSLPAAS